MNRPGKPRVFVTRRIAQEALNRIVAEAEMELWPEELPPPYEVLVEKAPLCEGLLTLLSDRIDAALLAASPALRVVSNLAVGYDNIDVAEATRQGIPVGNTPDVLTETTADLTFALLLAVARRVVEGDHCTRNGRWKTWHPSFLLGQDVHHATLGIVGLGRIGRELAKRARGFDMRLLYCSRRRQPEAEQELGLDYRDLDALLRESDFVTLHVPLSRETTHLIGERELALMKPTAFLINTSRGAVVDQKALYRALKERRIAGAGLDVMEVEPLPLDDPLLTLDNVVLTPHIGSASQATRAKMALMAAENLLAGLRGERLPSCVNPEVYE